MGTSFKMDQAQQVATQETAPAAAALPTPSQGKKSCKTFKKVQDLPANRGPRKPCKSILKRKKRTCAPRRKKKACKKVSRRRKASKKCAKKTSRRRRKSSRKRKAK